MILAGDLGGTKCNLGLYDIQKGKLTRVAHKRYASADHAGLWEIVQDFVRTTGAKVDAASFGVAGPIVDNRVKATNFPWIVDGAEMAMHLKLRHVQLINDLEATGYGIGVLEPHDVATLYEGIPCSEATRAVIAAGTGLGESVLFWDGQKHIAVASEAGHADFAPSTLQQADLWKFLKVRNKFVSAEMLLSGRGFQRVHEFLDGSVRHPGFDDPEVDPAPEITRRGLAGECPVCVSTLKLWIGVYGSEAGNLALRAVARGGIYVAGGIAVKILPMLKDGTFVAAARHKEKLGDFLAKVPIHVVLNEECPLMGAAYFASTTA